MADSEFIARRFHEVYEHLAPDHNYETRIESRCEWEDVPENNRELMISVVETLLDEGTINA